MKKIVLPVFMLLFLVFPVTGSDNDRGLKLVVDKLGENNQAGKQYLLLIAIDRYEQWFPLKNPVKDAKEIRDILVKRYYIDEVMELYDEKATKADIIKTFNNLQKILKSHDSLFIFYAGHGHMDDTTSSGFWIPVNAGTDLFEQRNWLPNTQIRGMLSNIKASHILLISDSCFSGDILDTSRAFAPEIDNDYFKKAYSRVSRQVLTSGSSETVPDVSEFAQQLKLAFERNMSTYLDPLMLFNEIRLGIRGTSPLLGSLKGTGHQEGASFLFFLSGEECAGDETGEKESVIKKDHGNISVKVTTRGQLYIDDSFKNDLADSSEVLIIDMESGSHMLEMRYEGGENEKKEVIVSKEATVHVEFLWKYTVGKLKINIKTAGKLYFNDIFYNTIKEGTEVEMKTGRYRAKMAYDDGETEERNINVTEGEVSVAWFTYIKKENPYAITSEAVSFDDHFLGGSSEVTRFIKEDNKYILEGKAKAFDSRGGWIGISIPLSDKEKECLLKAKGIKFKAKSNSDKYWCQFILGEIIDLGIYAVITQNSMDTGITILFEDCKQSEWAEQVDFEKNDINYIQFRNANYPGKNFNFTLEISELEFIPE